LARADRRDREDGRLRVLLHLGPRNAPAPALRPADVVRVEDPASAGDAQCPCDRDPRGGARLMPYDPGEVVEVLRAPRDNAAAGTYRAFAATLKGLKMTFGRMVEGPETISYPEEKTP